MRRVLFAILLFFCLSVPVTGQTLNPQGLEFDHPLAEYERTWSYLVEVWRVPANFETGEPIHVAEVLKEFVSCAIPPCDSWRIYFYSMPRLPVGTTYTFRVRAKDSLGNISDPSNATLVESRWSTCVDGLGPPTFNDPNGVIRPMTISVVTPLPQFTINSYATLRLNITSVAPVHRVTFQLLGSGLPAWSFYSYYDLRGIQPYMFGRLPNRTGSFLLRVEAVDEGGCTTNVGNTFISVVR